ncbi:unnamed protein product [Linum tenue]|uniref:Uncharacterized protein n=1 Tax=Linum tenue TaxID=586396 RepID=A0AAV0IW04_9ROSI|nr:unnamed protein product [Linum tenue]
MTMMAAKRSLRLARAAISSAKLNPRPRTLSSESGGGSSSTIDWKASLREQLRNSSSEQSSSVSIYRVPVTMRQVEPSAYTPNLVSIGPYHNGATHLMETGDQLKWRFVSRLFRSNRVELDPVFDALESMEDEARSFYADDVKIDGEFVRTMLLDGCFVIELLRELEKYGFRNGSPMIQKWMLPNLRRDLIMLENQLPLPVLQMLFRLTEGGKGSEDSYRDSLLKLALRFFSPLLQRESPEVFPKLQGGKVQETHHHFLDFFRSRILPREAIEAEALHAPLPRRIPEPHRHCHQEPNMIRSVKELAKARMFVGKRKNNRPLDVQSDGNRLVIPPIYLEDGRGTLFRNMVAFEQCHGGCKPQVTAYVFFLNGLINCEEDVALLTRKGIIHHTLGSNREAADLVNALTKEVVGGDTRESYLQRVLVVANSYMSTTYAVMGAPLVDKYFGNWVMALSTLGFCIYEAPSFMARVRDLTETFDDDNE